LEGLRNGNQGVCAWLQVCGAKGVHAAALLDTKGPEIRTAMLRGHKAIELVAGQSIIVKAVGEAYTSFEGYKDEFEGTHIGLSYDKLCQSVVPGAGPSWSHRVSFIVGSARIFVCVAA
jgi:pyruvate kinase